MYFSWINLDYDVYSKKIGQWILYKQADLLTPSKMSTSIMNLVIDLMIAFEFGGALW